MLSRKRRQRSGSLVGSEAYSTRNLRGPSPGTSIAGRCLHCTKSTQNIAQSFCELIGARAPIVMSRASCDAMHGCEMVCNRRPLCTAVSSAMHCYVIDLMQLRGRQLDHQSRQQRVRRRPRFRRRGRHRRRRPRRCNRSCPGAAAQCMYLCNGQSMRACRSVHSRCMRMHAHTDS